MSRAKATPKAPAATFVKPEKVAPAQRKGSSTVANPVGVSWVTCICLTASNGGDKLARKDYTKAVIEQGVTYYTARTQVNRYLQWLAAGSDPQGLPKGVTIS